MKFPRTTRRITMLMMVSALLFGIPAIAASASPAAAGTGWTRLAQLSPDTPAVDIYLYPSGNSNAEIVLHHVTYGQVSAYQAVTPGDYLIAWRPAGAAATTKPVLSTSVTVQAGHAYTVAGMGPESGLRLKVLNDALTAPPGKVAVRVIQASLKEPTVKVTCGGQAIWGKSVASGTWTSYANMLANTWTMSVTGGTARYSESYTLASGTSHTLVVLDASHGLDLIDLEDAAGAGKPPVGGVATGFGGTAGHGPGSPLPWLAIIGVGVLATLAGGLRLRGNGGQ